MQHASAPAKIILLGEHAVVYGQPAIAVPLADLRVTVRVTGPATTGDGIIIVDESSGQEFSITAPTDEPLAHTVETICEAIAIPIPDVRISLKSDIPVASGLGSGAAIATALARVLSMAANQPLDNDRLNEIVYQTEKIHHGTPSGIDNTVVVYEQPVFFVRDLPIEHLTIRQPFHLLIADTGKRALTKIAVGDVRKLYDASPRDIQPVLDAIGDLVRSARHAVEHGDIDALGHMMNRNHTLLQKLTVSSAELDALVAAATASGALGAKLSGGGRGGNMIALVTPQTAQVVENALYKAGAVQVYSTIVQS